MNPRERNHLIAVENERLCAVGSYTLPSGEAVSLSRLSDGTVLIPGSQPPLKTPSGNPVVEVTSESSLVAAGRVFEEHPLVLNFARATTPGGGYLKGSSAQEEYLCRRTVLYRCLLPFQDKFYDMHRALKSPMYTDAFLLSKGVMVIRDEGLDLSAPWRTDFLTAAAPCLIGIDPPQDLERLLDTRINKIIRTAVAHGYKTLILGAWGCGAFRNDPVLMARLFKKNLALFPIERAVMAVYATNPYADPNFQAFKREFA